MLPPSRLIFWDSTQPLKIDTCPRLSEIQGKYIIFYRPRIDARYKIFIWTAVNSQINRLRVAKSIRVFDIICSSILGRRSSAPQLRSVDVSPGDIEQDPSPGCHRALALRATYESCSILETVVGKFADDGSLNTFSAEHYLQLLREWSQVLPASLRQRPRQGDVARQGDVNHRETMIANVHVAGTYYFGIILVTRQFLIQHIVPQLRGGHTTTRRKNSQGLGNGLGDDDESGTIAELSRACIEAATYMAQMCREAVDAGVLLGNMCIIKSVPLALPTLFLQAESHLLPFLSPPLSLTA